ncbi:MAG TPA: hypothetical protein VLT16_12500 [Candidatus Limnocylindrales bacterium]|nr:hypothetical protein [Candidatus Limnocylindrales bacterium]
MKKAVLIVIVVILLAAVGIALIGRSSAAPVSMGSIGVTQPGAAARMVAGIRSRFTSGKSEIQRSLETKKSVKSFRMKTILRLHPGYPLETVVEVSCPDRERFTTTIGEQVFQAVRVADKAYVQQKDGTWTVQDTAASGWSPCGENPGEPAPWAVMNEGRDPSAVLAKLISNAEITRGAFVNTSFGDCQQWTLSLKMPGGAAHGHGASGLHYTLCIDPGRHLPVAVSMGSGGMVTSYYDWNKPIQIDAPKM